MQFCLHTTRVGVEGCVSIVVFFFVNLVLFPDSSCHTPPIHMLFFHYCCSYVDSFKSAVSIAAPLLCCVIVCLFASCFSNKKETVKLLKRMKGLVRVIYTVCINTFKMDTLNEM